MSLPCEGGVWEQSSTVCVAQRVGELLTGMQSTIMFSFSFEDAKEALFRTNSSQFE